MYQIIAPTLFQKKICRLPGIGTLAVVVHSAKSDFANSKINAPVEKIEFSEEKDEKIFNEFSAMSELLQKRLDENGSFLLKGIGTFTKAANGKIRFISIPVDTVFTPAVPVEIIARQDTSHAMLVGDQETTNVEMTELLNEREPENERWQLFAIVLAAIAIGVLLFYLYHHGLKSFGNVNY
ncbi:MAG: hypothetical protein JWP81_373 [Ferruginibacter sp.]|nr:hypothetical protein [Ferruginibacter sp.]